MFSASTHTLWVTSHLPPPHFQSISTRSHWRLMWSDDISATTDCVPLVVIVMVDSDNSWGMGGGNTEAHWAAHGTSVPQSESNNFHSHFEGSGYYLQQNVQSSLCKRNSVLRFCSQESLSLPLPCPVPSNFSPLPSLFNRIIPSSHAHKTTSYAGYDFASNSWTIKVGKTLILNIFTHEHCPYKPILLKFVKI